MKIRFPNSHAYPGGAVTVIEDDADDQICLVEFGDGAEAIGEIEPDGDGAMILKLPRRRTAKGTDIDAQRWRIVGSVAEGWRVRKMTLF